MTTPYIIILAIAAFIFGFRLGGNLMFKRFNRARSAEFRRAIKAQAEAVPPFMGLVVIKWEHIKELETPFVPMLPLL